jgi:hypothetical protein
MEVWQMTNGQRKWYDELREGVEEGRRYDSAIRLVGRWYGIGLYVQEVKALLTDWNERNRPPMGYDEIQDILRSTRKWEQPHRPIPPPMSDEEAAEIIKAVKEIMKTEKECKNHKYGGLNK